MSKMVSQCFVAQRSLLTRNSAASSSKGLASHLALSVTVVLVALSVAPSAPQGAQISTSNGASPRIEARIA